MTATSFNPLAAARDLEAAGVERRQAEAIAEGVREAADAAASARADLATKASLHTAIEPPARQIADRGTPRRPPVHRTSASFPLERFLFGFNSAILLAINKTVRLRLTAGPPP